jgi:hypothetical protein
MSFDDSDRGWLAALADVLIPAGPDMPSASQAEVAGKWLDAVLLARPDLVDALRGVLAKTRGRDAHEAVADLRAGHPASFAVLAEVVPGAYFMNPDVQRAIGYTGQGPRPIDPRADYMEDGLLESVIRRGPIYRRVPGTERPGGPRNGE